MSEQMKKCGSGIQVIFVENSEVSWVSNIYSYEHPNDLLQTKEAIKKLCALAKYEIIFKQEEREKKNGEIHKG